MQTAALSVFNPWAALVQAWADMLAAARGLLVWKSEGEGEGGGGEGGGEGGGGAAGGAGDGDKDEDAFRAENADLIKDVGEKAARQIVKVRDEAAKARLDAKNAREALAAKEGEGKSAEEKAAAREQAANEREARANERLVRAEVVAVATKQGAHDPDAVLALINREGVEVDDEGNVSGVAKAVADLLKQKPYLKGTAPAARSGGDGGKGGEPPADGDFNSTIRRMAGMQS